MVTGAATAAAPAPWWLTLGGWRGGCGVCAALVGRMLLLLLGLELLSAAGAAAGCVAVPSPAGIPLGLRVMPAAAAVAPGPEAMPGALILASLVEPPLLLPAPPMGDPPLLTGAAAAAAPPPLALTLLAGETADCGAGLPEVVVAAAAVAVVAVAVAAASAAAAAAESGMPTVYGWPSSGCGGAMLGERSGISLVGSISLAQRMSRW
jgi:hypothetical protein